MAPVSSNNRIKFRYKGRFSKSEKYEPYSKLKYTKINLDRVTNHSKEDTSSTHVENTIIFHSEEYDQEAESVSSLHECNINNTSITNKPLINTEFVNSVQELAFNNDHSYYTSTPEKIDRDQSFNVNASSIHIESYDESLNSHVIFQDSTSNSDNDSITPSTSNNNKLPIATSFRRIVDLQYVGEQMTCEKCDQQLSFKDIQYEIPKGLASDIYIQCENCKVLQVVRTSRSRLQGEKPVYDINLKSVIGN